MRNDWNSSTLWSPPKGMNRRRKRLTGYQKQQLRRLRFIASRKKQAPPKRYKRWSSI